MSQSTLSEIPPDYHKAADGFISHPVFAVLSKCPQHSLFYQIQIQIHRKHFLILILSPSAAATNVFRSIFFSYFLSNIQQMFT